MEIAWWILAVVLIIVGAVGTVVPALPGPVFVFAGALTGAWIDDFTRVGGWTIAAIGALAVLSWGVDYAAGVLGARRVGASREAVVGALAGTLLGVFSGLWGLLFMPLAGAAIGEYLARSDLRRAGTVGLATWIGMVVGAVAKLALTATMIAVFLFALFV